MASIVVQEQDLFFEFDFGHEITEQNKDRKLEQCKEDVFLIGCFRNDQKHQLEWIRSQREGSACGKYKKVKKISKKRKNSFDKLEIP